MATQMFNLTKAVYSVEGCGHGSSVISVANQRMVAMVISQFLVQGVKCQMK